MKEEGVRDAGCGMRDAGCGMRDAGCGMRDAGCEADTNVPPSISPAMKTRCVLVSFGGIC